MNPPSFGFPELNATLNAVCLVLLLGGYAAIRRGKVRLHITFMVSALAVSSVFLASYLYYHYTVGHVEFDARYPERHGFSPPTALTAGYRVILVTHIGLAVSVVPLALVTASLGLMGLQKWPSRLAWHQRIAYRTLPI